MTNRCGVLHHILRENVTLLLLIFSVLLIYSLLLSMNIISVNSWMMKLFFNYCLKYDALVHVLLYLHMTFWILLSSHLPAS